MSERVPEEIVTATLSIDEVESTHIAPTEEETPNRKRRTRPAATTTTTTSRRASTKKKTVAKTIKRARASVPCYYIVCPTGMACAGIVCADSEATAAEIVMADTGQTAAPGEIVPISMTREFCYPVSVGPPEQLPGNDLDMSASSGTPTLFCVRDFDFIPGLQGTAFVMAPTKNRVIALVDAYLSDITCRLFEEVPYDIAPVPLEQGFYRV